MSFSDEGRDKRNAEHLWHVWMNKRNDGQKEFDHAPYEFKNMLQFLEYGHEVIQRAFEGNLPTTHRQCSHQAPVPLQSNVLKCCLEGQDVTQCPILLSVKQVFEENKTRYDIPVEHLYRTMAKTCAWHIHGNAKQCDTSEGYLLDTSDRMFWENVYQSMAASDEPEGDEA